MVEREKGPGFKVGRWLVAGAAAFGLWAFVVNREVIQWPDSETKRLTIVALAMFFAAVAVIPLWRRWRGPWTRVGLVVILAFSCGELRRAWLRYQYTVESAGGPAISLLHPITTTDLVVRRYQTKLPGLPAARLRVVQVTDLHITEKLPSAYYEHLAATITAEDADILVFTGDYLSQMKRLPLLERWLATVPRARFGNYAVLGNHEHWLEPEPVRDAFERSGVTMLAGACRLVSGATGPLVRLCGTEAPWGPELSADAIARDAPGSLPLLVLSHTPDGVYPMHELGAAAVFAGHTHGGQIRLPVLGAIIIPSNYGRRFDLGHFNVEGTNLYVSAGVGADQPPIRIYCPPELVTVEFTP